MLLKKTFVIYVACIMSHTIFAFKLQKHPSLKGVNISAKIILVTTKKGGLRKYRGPVNPEKNYHSSSEIKEILLSRPRGRGPKVDEYSISVEHIPNGIIQSPDTVYTIVEKNGALALEGPGFDALPAPLAPLAPFPKITTMTPDKGDTKSAVASQETERQTAGGSSCPAPAVSSSTTLAEAADTKKN